MATGVRAGASVEAPAVFEESSAVTFANVPAISSPRVLTEPIATTATRPTSRPYSMRAAPQRVEVEKRGMSTMLVLGVL